MKEQNNKNTSIEELERAAQEIYGQQIEIPGSDRKTNLMTGVQGAKDYTISLMEFPYTLGGRTLSEETKQEIRDKVEAMDWQPGMYKLGFDGAEYVGLYDKDVSDGINLVQRGDEFYMEEWKDNWRKRWEKLSEEEFNVLKDKYGKTEI